MNPASSSPPTSPPAPRSGTLGRIGTFHRDARIFLVTTLVGGAELSLYWIDFNLYLASLGLSTATIGLVATVASTAGAIAAFPASALSDRVGRRAVMAGGVLLAIAALIGLLLFDALPGTAGDQAADLLQRLPHFHGEEVGAHQPVDRLAGEKVGREGAQQGFREQVAVDDAHRTLPGIQHRQGVEVGLGEGRVLTAPGLRAFRSRSALHLHHGRAPLEPDDGRSPLHAPRSPSAVTPGSHGHLQHEAVQVMTQVVPEREVAERVRDQLPGPSPGDLAQGERLGAVRMVSDEHVPALEQLVGSPHLPRAWG